MIVVISHIKMNQMWVDVICGQMAQSHSEAVTVVTVEA